MFFTFVQARRAAVILILTSLLSTPTTSHSYDLPKQRHEPAPAPVQELPAEDDAQPLPQPEIPVLPLDEQIPTLLPGNTVFPVEHCGIEYTICKFGKGSWDYIREMQLRQEIAQKQLWVDAAASETPPNEEWIDILLEELNALMEELQNLMEGRPVPQQGDPCLVRYRQCLMEEYKKEPLEEGRL